MEKELGRVPRPLSEAYNLGLIERLYESGGSVAIDLIIYFSNHQMKNLFGESWFSISDFCQTMNYERTKLHRKLTPNQKEELFGKQDPLYMRKDADGTEIVHPIETVFEAALYRLGKVNISFPVQNIDGSTSFEFVQIITKFDIKTDFKTKKGTKRLYCVTLNQRIKDSVFKHYNIIDLMDYKKLPDRTGYRYFYLNLASMICVVKWKICKGEAPHFTLTVDQLVRIFDIQVKRNDNKKTKISCILDSINELLSHTKFQYEYVKGKGQKWAYTVQFDFPQEVLDYFDEKFKAVFTQKFHEDLLWTFARLAFPQVQKVNIGRGSLLEKIQEIKATPELYQEFIKWAHSEQDISTKEFIYRDVFMKVFEKTPEDFGIGLFNLIDDFPVFKSS